jgi:lysosomal alpha-mannosidase
MSISENVLLSQASEDLGEASDLFTGVLFNNYGPPDGFCWDLLCNDSPIMDNPLLEGNLEERIAGFLAYVGRQAQYYKSDHIMLTMGMDFHYQAAHAWYMNLDKLIGHVNQLQSNGSNVNIFYSTPSCYLKSLQESGLTWPTKSDDFFPYASDPHAYWSGYFTSRPTSKRFIREAELYAKQLSQLTVLRQDPRSVVDQLSLLRETVGIVQHHDAATGTEKQHVAHDYHKRIYKGLAQGFGALNIGLEGLPLSAAPVMCEMLNISQCNAATEALASGAAVRLTVYNPLGWQRANHYGRVPVTDGNYVVEDETGELVPSELMPLPDWISSLPGRLSNASHELIFSTGDLPPLGAASFVIKRADKISRNKMADTAVAKRKHGKKKSSARKMSMDTLSAHIKVDPTTGALYILDKATGSGGHIKETVSRDFRPLVFFINQLPLGP